MRLERDSKRVWEMQVMHIDYALLLDGLKAEREQGIQLMWLIATSPPMDVNLSLRTLRDMSSTPVI